MSKSEVSIETLDFFASAGGTVSGLTQVGGAWVVTFAEGGQIGFSGFALEIAGLGTAGAVILSGTVTSVAIYSNPTGAGTGRTVLATGLTMDAADFWAALQTGEAANFWSLALKGDDGITGSQFGDRIGGLGGRDLIQGGRGNDTIKGGSGADTMAGGLGSDVLVGGRGPDSFVVDDRHAGGVTADKFMDFDPLSDRILFSTTSFQEVSGIGMEVTSVVTFGNKALDADDFFIVQDYGPGQHIYFDADANGAGKKVLIVDLVGCDVLTSSEVSSLWQLIDV